MADSEKTKALKIKLYDVIEQQAVMAAQHSKLEEEKATLAKQLGEQRAKDAAAEAD